MSISQPPFGASPSQKHAGAKFNENDGLGRVAMLGRHSPPTTCKGGSRPAKDRKKYDNEALKEHIVARNSGETKTKVGCQVPPSALRRGLALGFTRSQKKTAQGRFKNSWWNKGANQILGKGGTPKLFCGCRWRGEHICGMLAIFLSTRGM